MTAYWVAAALAVGFADEAAPETPLDCGTAAVYCFARAVGQPADFPAVAKALAPHGVAPYSMADLKTALATLRVPTEAFSLGGGEMPDRTSMLAYLQTGVVGHFVVCTIDRKNDRADLIDTRETWQGTVAELWRVPGWTGTVLVPPSPSWPRGAAVAMGLAGGLAGGKRCSRRRNARPKLGP